MSDKKRKRHDGRSDKSSRKTFAVNGTPDTLKVSSVEAGELWLPILASTPGSSLPSAVTLQPYMKPQSINSQAPFPSAEILLHSSFHPKLDHIVREEDSNGSEKYLQHYVGVYDPDNGKLQLVQARKGVVRSTLHSARVHGIDKDEAKPSNSLSARSNLGLAFGTKKSQKAIRALTANAIQASPSKSQSHSSPEKSRQLDPLASAVVSSMAESNRSMPTREELQAEIDENKPRPKPNMSASIPAEVYPLEQLVGGADVLAAMGVRSWIDKIKAGEDVQTKSRFIARRLKANVESGDVKRLKAMRYLLLLVEWFIALQTSNRGVRKVPKLEDMGALIESYGSEIVQNVARRFADGFEMNKWHMDNVITHILGLAITVDNFMTDVHDIRDDLKLENKDISKYYSEIGCAIAGPTETERARLGITKVEASNHRIAKLKLPLVFPKMRVPIAKKKR